MGILELDLSCHDLLAQLGINAGNLRCHINILTIHSSGLTCFVAGICFFNLRNFFRTFFGPAFFHPLHCLSCVVRSEPGSDHCLLVGAELLRV